MRTMKAAVLHGIGDLRVEEIPVPQITGPDEILVHVKAVGICGSDIHFFEDGRIGPYVVEKPIILGHELAAEVLEVGPQVTGLKRGDRVALEPGVPCRKCSFCKSGRYNLCATVPFMGTPPTDGAFREYLTWPADFAFRLPDSVSWEEGAMVEPLAVGVQACQRAKITGGNTVAVLGCGPIGLTALQAAADFGAMKIIATDVMPSRLGLAKELGASVVVNAAQTDPVQAVLDATEGQGVDVALETAGTAQTVRQACAMVMRGGVVMLVGMHTQDEFALPVMDVICREYDLRGVFRYCNAFGPAIAMLAANRVRLKPLMTHVFPLEQINSAFDIVRKQKDTSIKVQIQP